MDKYKVKKCCLCSTCLVTSKHYHVVTEERYGKYEYLLNEIGHSVKTLDYACNRCHTVLETRKKLDITYENRYSILEKLRKTGNPLKRHKPSASHLVTQTHKCSPKAKHQLPRPLGLQGPTKTSKRSLFKSSTPQKDRKKIRCSLVSPSKRSSAKKALSFWPRVVKANAKEDESKEWDTVEVNEGEALAQKLKPDVATKGTQTTWKKELKQAKVIFNL